MNCLTCLANVKTWLELTQTTDDALLTGMIGSFSDIIMSYLERPSFALTTFNEYRDGVGNQKLMLRNWPAISVSAVQISQATYGYGGSMFGSNSGLLSPPQSIPAQPSWGQPGYFLEPWDGTAAGKPQNLIVSGYNFPRGKSNILITYKAGYAITGEAQTIPGSVAYTVAPSCPTGPFLADNGPTYANGTAFTLVSVLTGAAGQYTLTVNPTTGIATYTFNAADAGAAILLNYSFVPSSIERACIQWIGEQYSYRKRIGQTTRSMGGQETASYSQKDMPAFLATVLQPYKKWIPL